MQFNIYYSWLRCLLNFQTKKEKSDQDILLYYLSIAAVRFLKNLGEIYCSLCRPESICLCQSNVMDSMATEKDTTSRNLHSFGYFDTLGNA